MTEILSETPALMLEEPEAINIDLAVPRKSNISAWRNGAYRVYTPGFTVVGTEKLFAVYEIGDKARHWGLAHVPSGVPMFAKFRIREEAEEFGSWVWLNAVNQRGLPSVFIRDIQSALGPRVRSRFAEGKILHSTRPARGRALGTSDGALTPTERLLAERAAMLRLHIADTTAAHASIIKSLNEKALLVDAKLRELGVRDKSLKDAEANLSVRREQQTQYEDDILTRMTILETREQALYDAETRVQTLRDRIAGALMLCIDDNQGMPGVVRALRGIKIRGNTMDEPAY
jgi:hypothetical protein